MSDAVLLVAHGSRDPRAAATVTGLVAAVRGRLRARPGNEAGRALVRVAYLDFTEPSVGQALTELAADGASQIRVVPMLFTPGYHLQVDLPSAVAEVRAGLPWLQVSVAEPLGVAPEAGQPDLLLDALEERLRATNRPYGAVVLASAGSSDPEARRAVEEVAARWAERSGRPVVPAFATAVGPRVDEAVHGLTGRGYDRVAVSGLFIAPGRLPEMTRRTAVAAGAAAVAEPLGPDPSLVRLLTSRGTSVRTLAAR
ncbi:MAG: sirohydrochlorin chelatase [Actinomycetales bacterium]